MQHAAGLAEVCIPAHVLLDHLLDFLRAQRARYPCASSDDQIFRHGWPPFRLKDERGAWRIDRSAFPLTLSSPPLGARVHKVGVRGEGYASSGQTTMPVPERQARAGM